MSRDQNMVSGSGYRVNKIGFLEQAWASRGEGGTERCGHLGLLAAAAKGSMPHGYRAEVQERKHEC